MKAPEEIKILHGNLMLKPSFNKIGRRIEGADSLFFIVDNQHYFVKIQEGKVTRTDLLALLAQPLNVRGYLTDGLWDSDDPTVQSRIGKYVAILEILDK